MAKSKEQRERERRDFLNRPARDKALQFVDELQSLINKYDMLNNSRPGGPRVCYSSIGNDRVKVFVDWPYDPAEEEKKDDKYEHHNQPKQSRRKKSEAVTDDVKEDTDEQAPRLAS